MAEPPAAPLEASLTGDDGAQGSGPFAKGVDQRSKRRESSWPSKLGIEHDVERNTGKERSPRCRTRKWMARCRGLAAEETSFGERVLHVISRDSRLGRRITYFGNRESRCASTVNRCVASTRNRRGPRPNSGHCLQICGTLPDRVRLGIGDATRTRTPCGGLLNLAERAVQGREHAIGTRGPSRVCSESVGAKFVEKGVRS